MNRHYPETIIKATKDRIEEIFSLLDNVQLPKEGVLEHLDTFFIVTDKNTDMLLGCIGLEIYEDDALIRSLAVHPSYHNKGLGSKLINHIHEFASSIGIKRIYLLTETAKPFFERFNYQVIPRSDTSSKVQQSIEFKSLCPETATCMVKFL
jgi:amino-acid N-acetyltransferase